MSNSRKTVTGLIHKIYDNDKNFNIIIDGNGYSQRDKPNANEGDNVEITYTERDYNGRTYNNIVKNGIKVLASTPQASSGPATSTKGTPAAKVDWAEKDRKIQRMSTQKQALHLFEILVEAEVVKFKAKKEGDNVDIALDYVFKLADAFDADVNQKPTDKTEEDGTSDVQDDFPEDVSWINGED